MVRIERHEYPEETAGSDANWLDGEVELTVGSIGSFRAREVVALRTEELERFRDQLRKLEADRTGEATLEHLEEQVGVTVKLEAGNGTLAGFVRDAIGAELRFEGSKPTRRYWASRSASSTRWYAHSRCAASHTA